jgi:Sulfatase
MRLGSSNTMKGGTTGSSGYSILGGGPPLWCLGMALLVSICMTIMGIYRMHPNMPALMQTLNDVSYSTTATTATADLVQSTSTTATSTATSTSETQSSIITTTSSSAATTTRVRVAVEDASLRGGGTTASTTTTPDTSDSKQSVADENPAVAAAAATAPTTNTETRTATASPKEDSKAAPKQPMNVVLFYADDWTYKTLGLVNDYVKSPHLDQLAKEGMLFTHNCVTTSICMQSRAALYTGQYVSRHQTLFSWRNVTMYEPDRWKQTLYPLICGQVSPFGTPSRTHLGLFCQ